jgi:hypothetical protein
MEGNNTPEETEQAQPDPTKEQAPGERTAPVPTDFRRNVWLLAIIFGAVIIAWVLSLLWKRAPQEMVNLPQGAAPPSAGASGPAAPSGLPPTRRLEAPLPPPVRVSVARIIGSKSEVIQAAPALSLPSGGLTYRLARDFDVTNRVADFQIEALFRLIGRWADQLPALAADSLPQSPFTPASDVTFLQPMDRVLVLSNDTETRAYPIRSIRPYCGVYDSFGGRRVFVSWCTPTQLAQCFVASLDGRDLGWHDAGLLYRGNGLYYDDQSGSLWDPFSGQALAGPLAGRIAEQVPVIVWQWDQWKLQHPTAPVLATGLLTPSPETLDADRVLEAYFQGPRLPVEPQHFNPAATPLPPKSFVLGVSLEGKDRAYPLGPLAAERAEVVKDTLGGRSVEVHVTSPRTGFATSDGKLLDARVMFWFAWQECRPQTDLYQLKAQEAPGPAQPQTPVKPAQ